MLGLYERETGKSEEEEERSQLERRLLVAAPGGRRLIRVASNESSGETKMDISV